MFPALWLALTAFSYNGQAAYGGDAADILHPQRSTAPIIVMWPPEGLTMPLSDGEFVFGSVSDPSAPLTINGTTIAVHSNGAFLAWLPVSSGTFSFNFDLNLKDSPASFVRRIFVAAPPPPLPEKPLAVDPESIWPKADMELRSGDSLTFRMRASPGRKAQCRLGKKAWQDMRESSPGIYEALQTVIPGDDSPPAEIACRVKSGWSSAQAFSRGRVALSSGPPPVAIVKSGAVLRTGPGNGYMAFPPAGVRLVTAGRAGNEFKVSLSASLEGWIDAKDVELLPPGTPAPRAVAGAVNVTSAGPASVVRVSLSEKVAFAVDDSQEPGTVILRLFNCVGHINWIVYDSAEKFAQEVRWRQEATGAVVLAIRLNADATLWGWQATYEGNSLKLELRSAPALAEPPASALAGRAIIVDPGHSPSSAPTDAAGPLGTREMDANFAIAKAVEALLLKKGAAPVLTRPANDVEISLPERTRLAVEKGGELFVSVHNNALPDGSNPFAKPRGFSVFYYHPQSLALARHIYRSFEKRVPFPGEDVRYGNLAVARLSAMPAVLVESLYMMFPAHEEKLNDPAFRSVLAEAIVAGLESFLDAERDRQNKAKAAAQTGKPPAPELSKAPAAARLAKPSRKAKKKLSGRKS
ncbi:MAG TPA: hypothetical protein DEB40_06760 [Elusimicrobia bacterium]|nr:hypothetical protein [Elusimicrobiota bacterium]HBT61428.1 hypothetical protein [Elusimicrobiota bacterium]